jgi:hypothetical protein
MQVALGATLPFFGQKILQNGHEWGESNASTDSDKAVIMLVTAERCNNVEL